MTGTWVSTARNVTAAIRPIPGKARGCNRLPHETSPHIGMDRAARTGLARRGRGDARPGNTRCRGRRGADHGAVRSPDDRIRARRRAPRPAVRVVPPECGLPRYAAVL